MAISTSYVMWLPAVNQVEQEAPALFCVTTVCGQRFWKDNHHNSTICTTPKNTAWAIPALKHLSLHSDTYLYIHTLTFTSRHLAIYSDIYLWIQTLTFTFRHLPLISQLDICSTFPVLFIFLLSQWYKYMEVCELPASNTMPYYNDKVYGENEHVLT